MATASVALLAYAWMHIDDVYRPFWPGDYKISLPGGYSLWEFSSERIGLVSPDPEPRIIAGPHVDGYRVYTNVIVGHVVSRLEFDEMTVGGYFILELKSGDIHQGLDRKEWLSEMRHYGIHQLPKLHAPSSTDELNRFNKPSDL